MASISKEKFAKLIAEARKRKEEAEQIVQVKQTEPVQTDNQKLNFSALREKLKLNSQSSIPVPLPVPAEEKKVEKVEETKELKAPIRTGIDGSIISYNLEQQQFVDLVTSGKSCVLIGSAGSGKTTSTQGAIQELLNTGKVPIIQDANHKYLVDGAPGIIITSYTRRAVSNIKKVLPNDLKANCITVHKLLEYSPQYFEVLDPNTDEMKSTMRFLPSRNQFNPLPVSIHTIIVEESSMLSKELYEEIISALDPAHVERIQWIFIGDIQQLPPIFGSAILGYKMLELPVIELTQIYRQALESPIIRLAQRILSGKILPHSEYESWNIHGQLTIHPWKKKLHPDTAAMTLSAFFTKAIDNLIYDPEEDMILIPYNKSCGTIELNKAIANHLARKRNATTFEIIAGFNKHYFSVGDRVMYDKEDAEIVEISVNLSYAGRRAQPESKTLDYWGHNPNLRSENNKFDLSTDDVDFLLSQVEASEERVNQASHKITVKLLDSGVSVSLTKAVEINSLLHAYAMTVHKSQGSEWRKVFLCFHQSHVKMLQRELLYTAVTRAKQELYIICEPETFTKGILSQKIKGNSLKDKAEWFKGKLEKETIEE
jgi:exodeoxyribonuclease V alpha subunit